MQATRPGKENDIAEAVTPCTGILKIPTMPVGLKPDTREKGTVVYVGHVRPTVGHMASTKALTKVMRLTGTQATLGTPLPSTSVTVLGKAWPVLGISSIQGPLPKVWFFPLLLLERLKNTQITPLIRQPRPLTVVPLRKPPITTHPP